MIGGMTAWLVARKISPGLARVLAIGAVALGALAIAAAIVACTIAAIYGRGERAGAAKVEVKARAEHGRRVAEARQDERAAAGAAAVIERRTRTATTSADVALAKHVQEIDDALASIPPAAAGAPPPAAPVGSLLDTLNAGIDRANRAADAADGAR